MHIRRPRGLTGIQIGLATVLGIAGGIYIWQPLFKQFTASGDNQSVKGTTGRI